MPHTSRPGGPGRGHKRKIGNGQLWGAGAGESSPRKSLPLFGRDRPQPAPEAKREGWVKKKEAERRAWATVNKESGGGKKSGSGRGKKESHASSRKGGRIGGSSQSHEKRSAAAKKGWETRRKRAHG